MSWLRLMEQSIKQDVPATEQAGAAAEQPVDEAAKEHVAEEPKPAITSKKHKVKDLVKEMWPAYLVEIFVIILGISITLALEEWRDNSKEKELEKIYQKNLLADLEVDLQSLQYVTANTQKLLTKGNELLHFIKSPSQYSLLPNQVYEDIRSILGRPDFISSDATFSDLKNSGNLHLIKDIHLKNLLFSYYSLVQNIKENQDAERQATITISGSYFLKWFPMGDMGNQQIIDPGRLKDLPKNVEFANNVLLRVLNRNELLGRFQKATSLGNQLKNALTEKVDN